MSSDKMDKIVVLDFGSQYSHLICRRIREVNVYCELLPYNTPARLIKEMDPKGIIFSGGPASVYAKNAPKPDTKLFEMGRPILGICYGHQVLVDRFGGRVKRAASREYGRASLKIDDDSDLFRNLGAGMNWNGAIRTRAASRPTIPSLSEAGTTIASTVRPSCVTGAKSRCAS